MLVTLVRWTCRRSPILPSGSEPRRREVEQHQRLVAGEGEVERLEQLVQPRHQDLVDAHDRGDRDHLGRGLPGPALLPVAARLLDRVEWEALRGHAGESCTASSRRLRRSVLPEVVFGSSATKPDLARGLVDGHLSAAVLDQLLGAWLAGARAKHDVGEHRFAPVIVGDANDRGLLHRRGA